LEIRSRQRLDQAISDHQNLANKENTTVTGESKQMREQSAAKIHRRDNDSAGKSSIEDSESEEEGWNGGLFMFSGLVEWNRGHYKEELEADVKGEEEEVVEERAHCEISDDEDDVVMFSSQRSQEVIGDQDSEPEVSNSEKVSEVKPPVSQIVVDGGTLTVASGPLTPCTSSVPLSASLCSYGDNDEVSDDGSDDGPPVEVKISKTESVSNFTPVVTEQRTDSNVSATATATQVAGGSDNLSKGCHRKRKHKAPADSKLPVTRPKVARPDVFQRPIRPPTLLEKLLLDEIKRERNLILQCVRYVCDENFFLS
jgi:hypothetical protein